MSTRRRKYGSTPMWLFKLSTLQNNNIISDNYNKVGIYFEGTKTSEKLQTSINILGNRAMQSTTTETYEVVTDIEFKIGDNVSFTKNPDDSKFSTIVNLKSKEIYDRGIKHNKKTIKKWVIEIS